MNQNTGKYLIFAGVIVLTIGILIYFFSDKLQWLGKLPGDMKYESKGLKIYFPFVSMVLISLIINLLIYFFRKLNQ